MYYGAIKNPDIANGPGVRVSIFVSGCRNHCEDCFQPETWDFHYGSRYSQKTTGRAICAALQPIHIQGLSILGGEPMEPENQKDVWELIRDVIITSNSGKDIWLYSGYTLEELLKEKKLQTDYTREILNHIDVLVDGRFEKDKKDITLTFRGSSNQRIINMRQTMKEPSEIILSKYHNLKHGGTEDCNLLMDKITTLNGKACEKIAWDQFCSGSDH